VTDDAGLDIAWASAGAPFARPASGDDRTRCRRIRLWASCQQSRQVGRPLRMELEGLLSARRGDYRVLYQVDDKRHRVNIVTVEHRGDVYRRRG
jgi:mRNA-degrading endonuclease RelE of RelBE toxin-antitoxin system